MVCETCRSVDPTKILWDPMTGRCVSKCVTAARDDATPVCKTCAEYNDNTPVFDGEKFVSCF